MMEHTPQAGLPAAEAEATSPGAEHSPAALPPGGEEALREELAKWRERVPRLAAALRQRAEEVASLKEELERLRRTQAAGDDASAGIRARDELIAELEAKVTDLSQRHKSGQADLHRRRLEVEELEADAAGWRKKWQSVTRDLDEQSAVAGEREQRNRALEEENEDLRQRLAEREAAHEADRQALEEAADERDGLLRRNEQLFETTELANRQIGSLTDSIAELRASMKQQGEREEAASAEREAMAQELEALRAKLSETEAAAEREREALHRDLHLASIAAVSGVDASAEADLRIAQADRAKQAAEERLEETLAERESLQASLDEQRREVERLTDVVEQAQRVTGDRENERRVLSAKLQTLEARNQHLEEQLEERSELVVNLEQDHSGMKARWDALQQERDELEEALIRAERHAKENADYVAQLDGRLERQKELMEDLEEELAEAREEQARAQRARSGGTADPEAEVARLRDQVRKLEDVVRERTDTLDRLQWQHGVAVPDAGAHGEDESPTSGDDLTRIHGVGDKLAEQLNELGIHRYQQIAELDEDALADEDHVLHPHRGRILRDGWIDQAIRLISH